jgi:hypothetical protein
VYTDMSYFTPLLVGKLLPSNCCTCLQSTGHPYTTDDRSKHTFKLCVYAKINTGPALSTVCINTEISLAGRSAFVFGPAFYSTFKRSV